MIEKIVLDYLTDQLDVDVYMEEPTEDLTEYIVIEKTGSSEIDRHVMHSTLAIKSYGASTYEAAVLNENVKTAMKGIISLNDVARCSLNSDYNWTDTTRKKYRYQAVFDLVHY